MVLKKWLVGVAFASIVLTGGTEGQAQLNEYGLAVEEAQFEQWRQAENWQLLKTHHYVDVNKVFKVNFNKKVELEKIQAVVVEGEDGFVPVKVEVVGQKQLKVIPLEAYKKGAAYELKIVLSNSKKYVVPFTTEKDATVIDQEPNYEEYEATPIAEYTYGKGQLSTVSGDGFDMVDLYVIPASKEKGKVTLTLESSDELYVRVYSETIPNYHFHHDPNYKKATYTFTSSSKPIYIGVFSYNDSKVTPYTLKTAFEKATLTRAEQKQYESLLAEWRKVEPTYNGPQAFNIHNTYPYQYGNGAKEMFAESLALTNFIRKTAGLSSDVKLNEAYNKFAQYGAGLLAIGKNFGHHPPKPAKMLEADYEIGYAGTSNSNLAFGYKTMTDAIKGFMDDSSVESVGHRSWILTPNLTQVGFGFNTDYATMFVHDETLSFTDDYEPIVWPVAGMMPIELTVSGWSMPISISLPTSQYELNAVDDIVVEVTYNGQKYTYTKATTNHFTIVDGIYGYQEQVLVFNPDDLTNFTHGDRLHVKVKGIRTASGEPTTFEYSTVFVSLEDFD